MTSLKGCWCTIFRLAMNSSENRKLEIMFNFPGCLQAGCQAVQGVQGEHRDDLQRLALCCQWLWTDSRGLPTLHVFTFKPILKTWSTFLSLFPKRHVSGSQDSSSGSSWRDCEAVESFRRDSTQGQEGYWGFGKDNFFVTSSLLSVDSIEIWLIRNLYQVGYLARWSFSLKLGLLHWASLFHHPSHIKDVHNWCQINWISGWETTQAASRLAQHRGESKSQKLRCN